ncbi:hypothetical protein ACFTWS_06085 [Streptomyces sp. NPDC057027]|uniref:hypothetical protein n=1 Tax=Streptomyces sp. NPDC057027 TaxID=3346004 RepID=UPI003637F204
MAAVVPVIELIADGLLDTVRAELDAAGENDLFSGFAHTLMELVNDPMASTDSFVRAPARHRLPDGPLLDPKTVVGAVFFVFVAGHATTGRPLSTVLRPALAEPGVWPRTARDEGFAGA